MLICDACKKEVSHTEDATVLESIAFKSPAMVFTNSPRHIRCSPSRAQYIMHENFEPVVDNRASWDKRILPENMRETREKIWTDAWVELMTEGGS